MGIGSETIMETEIEQEECDEKWNGMGIRVGNMKQNEYQNMKRVGEWNGDMNK